MIKGNLTDSSLYEERFKFKEGKSDFTFLIVLLCLVLCFFGVSFYFTQTHEAVCVKGSSMNQTLNSGDWLLMKKGKAQRGDVIIVDVRSYPQFQGDTTHLIKRLIAVEGDKVKCVDGVVEIMYAGTSEWQTLNEPYAYYKDDKKNYDFAEYTVGEGEIFFLGDNRMNSMDSRYKENCSRIDGLYSVNDIYGVVTQFAIDNQDFLEFIFIPEHVKNATTVSTKD